MGSIVRRAGAAAAVTLIGTGIAAVSPSVAFAQTVNVPCSGAALVNAITTANGVGGAVLRLASNCNYDLTAAAATGTRGPDGLPIITGNLALIGGRSTVIRRTAGTFRIIEVGAGARLFAKNVFINDGDAGANPGGGILNARGSVKLDHVTVAGNHADSGGAIADDSGRILLSYTLVAGNTSTAGGGGAYNDGTLISEFSRFAANHAGTGGGGVFNEVGAFAAFRTTLDHNTAGANGGGLNNAAGGSSTLTSTLVTRNSAANGGGIFSATGPGPVRLSRSQIDNNFPNNCAPTGFVSGCTG